MNREDWDARSHTEWMTPCIGLRAAYRTSVTSTLNTKTDRATLLGQNNHEFQVVITGSSLCSYRCFSHTVTANDPRPSTSCSVQKSPHCMPTNTPGVFPDLQPRIWPHLLHLVMKAVSDRLLAGSFYTYLKNVCAYDWETRQPSGLGSIIHADCRKMAKHARQAQ